MEAPQRVHAERRQRQPDGVPDRRPGGPRIVRGDDPGPFHHEAGHQDDLEAAQDPPVVQDAARIGRRAVEPVAARLRTAEAAEHRHADADDGRQPHDVQEERLEPEVEVALHDPEDRVEVAEILVDHHHDGADEQHHEAPREQQVGEAAVPSLDGTALGDGVLEHGFQAAPGRSKRLAGLPALSSR